jgi:site-specific recombinase XerD
MLSSDAHGSLVRARRRSSTDVGRAGSSSNRSSGGKVGHIRTVPMPGWVKAAVDQWVVASGISARRLFRCVCRAGKHWGDGVTERVVWHVVKQYAKKLGVARLAPHDLRRSCAKLCHSAGGELEQIQFLLGYVSVQTTERYLGGKQRIQGAVNGKRRAARRLEA